MIEFTRPASEFVEVARLRIVCPHHPEEVLGEVCRSATGNEWVESDAGMTTENVAATGTREAVAARLAQGRPLPFGVPDAEVEEGDSPHLRKRFRCPRPSCGYDGQVRADPFYMARDKLLERMVADGIRVLTVCHVDRPPVDWELQM